VGQGRLAQQLPGLRIKDERPCGLGGPHGHLAEACRRGHLRDPATPGLLGRFPCGGPPPRHRPLAALPLPPGHAALRRPRDDHVHPGLGHQLDSQLAPLPLGDRLDHGQDRVGGRQHPAAAHRELELAALGPGHHALGHLAVAVGQVHPLTGGEPPHEGRVAALGTGQHDQVGDQVRGVGEEDRRLGPGPTPRVTGRVTGR
jgi:hypothetical protein